MAWNVIQTKFWFDNPSKRKKYVLSWLGSRCNALKQRLWKNFRRNTIEESIDARPPLIPEDQWRHFVYIQFTEKAKKTRERNIRNREKLKLIHALGKKTFARKAYDTQEKTGKEPSRAELFIASRTRLDGSFVCDKARTCVIKEVMDQNIKKEASSNDSEIGLKDDFEQIFCPERSGRVLCVGRGPPPSKYFQSLESKRSMKSEVVDLKSQMEGLKDKFDIVVDALQVLISNNQFQASTMGGSTKVNINLPQIISLRSQASTMGGSMNLPQTISLLSQVSNHVHVTQISRIVYLSSFSLCFRYRLLK